jgi:hypothetical protein
VENPLQVEEDEAEEVKELKRPKATRRKKKKKEPVDPRLSAERWVWMQANRKLPTRLQEVILEFSTKLAGREIKTRIPVSGTWIWISDAEMILELGPLASCNGTSKLKRPFSVSNPPRALRDQRPQGPPTF